MIILPRTLNNQGKCGTLFCNSSHTTPHGDTGPRPPEIPQRPPPDISQGKNRIWVHHFKLDMHKFLDFAINPMSYGKSRDNKKQRATQSENTQQLVFVSNESWQHFWRVIAELIMTRWSMEICDFRLGQISPSWRVQCALQYSQLLGYLDFPVVPGNLDLWHTTPSYSI